MSERRPRMEAGRVVVAAAVLGAGVASSAGGCTKPLFSERYQRTQYDTYDRSRNQFARQYVEDEYGRREPNLWGRLSPKD